MALPVALVRKGTKFSARYVDLLIKQVNSPVVVMTDQPDHGDISVPLEYNLKGWWSKLELFSPEFRDHRPCLFLDLDTYVLGGIDDILSFDPEGLWMLRDFYRPNGGQSAMMLIPKDTDEIWDRFIAGSEHIMQMPGGDQAYLEKFPFKRLQDRFEGIYSYKADNLKDSPRGRVVCFHGKPKPPDCTGWAGDIWTNG